MANEERNQGIPPGVAHEWAKKFDDLRTSGEKVRLVMDHVNYGENTGVVLTIETKEIIIEQKQTVSDKKS